MNPIKRAFVNIFKIAGKIESSYRTAVFYMHLLIIVKRTLLVLQIKTASKYDSTILKKKDM